MTEEQQTQTKTATQRIEDLERAMLSVYQALDTVAKELNSLKETAKLLVLKTDSMIQAAGGTEPVTTDVVAKIMLDSNVEELRNRVNMLIGQGILVPTDAVAENTFVVAREIAEDGKVANPRLQFPVSSMSDDLKAIVMNAKAGELIVVAEGRNRLEVTEVYAIVEPQQPEPEAQPTEAPTA